MKFIASLLFLVLSCGPNIEVPFTVSHAKSKFKAYGGQKVHVEIEPSGQMSQVFYFVSPHDLAEGLSLNKSFEIQGSALGAKKYLDLDRTHEHENLDHFSDIIALPKANKTNFLSPRIPAVSTRLSSDNLYNLALLDNLSYAIILNPSGLYDKAPIYLNLEKQQQTQRLDFNLNPAGPSVQGQISSSNLKKELWQVRVLQGSRLVSSRGRVQKDGSFKLELANQMFLGNDVPLTLLIEPENQELPLPRVKKIYRASELYSNPQVGTVNMGRFGKPLTLYLRIPAPGNVYISGSVGAGEVLIKKPLDSTGLTKIEGLYEGFYDLALVPPVESKWAMRVIEKVDLSGSNLTLTLKWQQRQLLRAKVVDMSGEAVSGAHLEFARIGKMGAFATEDIFTTELFPFTANTNEEGQVCKGQVGTSAKAPQDCVGLGLDEGRYLVHIIPPPGSKHAHQWLTFDFPRSEIVELVLKKSALLNGKILGPDKHTPVKQAYITIYAADNNLHSQPKVVANALTDHEGIFSAFVPSP